MTWCPSKISQEILDVAGYRYAEFKIILDLGHFFLVIILIPMSIILRIMIVIECCSLNDFLEIRRLVCINQTVKRQVAVGFVIYKRVYITLYTNDAAECVAILIEKSITQLKGCYGCKTECRSETLLSCP